MSRSVPRFGSLVVLAVLLVAGSGRAEDRHLLELERELALPPAPGERVRAAERLAQLDDEAAIPPLCKALGDPDPTVRVAVAKALGSLGGAAAKSCLTGHRADPVPQSRAAVRAALAQVRSQRSRRIIRYVVVEPPDPAHNPFGPEAAALATRQVRRALERSGALVGDPKVKFAKVRRMLRKRRLGAFAIELTLAKAANDAVSLDLLCTRYPKNSIIGDVRVTARGAELPDLIRALAPRVVDQADAACGWRADD